VPPLLEPPVLDPPLVVPAVPEPPLLEEEVLPLVAFEGFWLLEDPHPAAPVRAKARTTMDGRRIGSS
jgi:hypothetical protein